MRLGRFTGVGPLDVLALPCSMALAAASEAEDARLEPYRIAVYPLWLEHMARKKTWPAFIRSLGLDSKLVPHRAAARLQKPDKDKLAALYAKAARIRDADLARENLNA